MSHFARATIIKLPTLGFHAGRLLGAAADLPRGLSKLEKYRD